MRKLYLFTNTKGNGASGWEDCLAMSDNGEILASHICSHVCYMYGDLIGNRPERTEMYEKHFGGKLGKAFKVIELYPGEIPPDNVIEKNRILGEKAIHKENMAKVEIEIEK